MIDCIVPSCILPVYLGDSICLYQLNFITYQKRLILLLSFSGGPKQGEIALLSKIPRLYCRVMIAIKNSNSSIIVILKLKENFYEMLVLCVVSVKLKTALWHWSWIHNLTLHIVMRGGGAIWVAAHWLALPWGISEIWWSCYYHVYATGVPLFLAPGPTVQVASGSKI